MALCCFWNKVSVMGEVRSLFLQLQSVLTFSRCSSCIVPRAPTLNPGYLAVIHLGRGSQSSDSNCLVLSTSISSPRRTKHPLFFIHGQPPAVVVRSSWNAKGLKTPPPHQHLAHFPPPPCNVMLLVSVLFDFVEF